MVKVSVIPDEGDAIRAISSSLSESALDALTTRILEGRRLLDENIARGQENFARLLGAQMGAPQHLGEATKEVIDQAIELFSGEVIPSDRIEVELVHPKQRDREDFQHTMYGSGMSSLLPKVIYPQLGKAMNGVVDEGLCVPRVVDGKWRHTIQIYTRNPNGMTRREYLKRFPHELGHAVQIDNGNIGKAYFEFEVLESQMQVLWGELCGMSGMPAKQAPLTEEALKSHDVAVMRIYPKLVSQSVDYQVMWKNYEALVRKRDGLEPANKRLKMGSKTLREGFACWFGNLVLQEIGEEVDADYVPRHAVESPYRHGLALFDRMPMPKAFEVGMTATSDAELERASAVYS